MFREYKYTSLINTTRKQQQQQQTATTTTTTKVCMIYPPLKNNLPSCYEIKIKHQNNGLWSILLNFVTNLP